MVLSLILLAAAILSLSCVVHAAKGDARNPCADAWEDCLFDGRFRLVKKLGAGAFGQVWSAEDTLSENAVVAVKMLDLRKPADVLPRDFDRRLRGFHAEAEVLRVLEHSHLNPYLATFEDKPGDWLGIVMEYAPRGSLKSLLEADGAWRAPNARYLATGERTGAPAPEALVRRLLVQVGSALGFMANQSIVHRDVKPDNILVRADGSLMLADVGIAVISREFSAGVRAAGLDAEELARRLNQNLIVDGDMIDNDGDGKGDVACTPPSAQAVRLDASGQPAPAFAGADVACHAAVFSKRAGTSLYMAPEMRDNDNRVKESADLEAMLKKLCALFKAVNETSAATENACGELKALKSSLHITFSELADAYSLGATAFALMTGGELTPLHRVPFSSEEILKALPALYSLALRNAVTGLLQADPSSRFSVAAAIAALGEVPVQGALSARADAVENECNSLATCDACTAHPMCGFCGSTGVCLPLRARDSGHSLASSGCSPQYMQATDPKQCDGLCGCQSPLEGPLNPQTP